MFPNLPATEFLNMPAREFLKSFVCVLFLKGAFWENF